MGTRAALVPESGLIAGNPRLSAVQADGPSEARIRSREPKGAGVALTARRRGITAAAPGPSSSGRFEVGNLSGALLRLALEASLDGHAGHERVADEAVGVLLGIPHG